MMRKKSLVGEIRWAVAATLLGWVVSLTQKEASTKLLQAFHDASAAMIDG